MISSISYRKRAGAVEFDSVFRLCADFGFSFQLMIHVQVDRSRFNFNILFAFACKMSTKSIFNR